MSLQLALAAANGDIAQVQQLLLNPLNNINWEGTVTVQDGSGKSMNLSPLTAAIYHQQWEMVRFLLANGAVCFKESYQICRLNDEKNAYNFALTSNRYIDPTVFKLLATQAQELHPYLIPSHQSPLESLECCNQKSMKALVIFYEALLRNARQTLQEILRLKIIIPINAKAFQDFLDGRVITAVEASNLISAIDYLVDNKCILNSIADELIEVIPVEVRCSLHHLHPFHLSKAKKNSKRSLAELFCEFQYHISHGATPACSVESEIFKALAKNNFDTTVAGLAAIKAQQNPQNLRFFLQLDPSVIMLRLNACQEDSSNPALELFTEMVLYHHETLIAVNNKPEPLLSKSQHSTALSVLSSFDVISQTDKLLLSTIREQQTMMAALSEQNTRLQEQIDRLSELLTAKNNEPAISTKRAPTLFG